MRDLLKVVKGRDGGNRQHSEKAAADSVDFGRTANIAAALPETHSTKHQPQAKLHSNNKITQLILIFRMRWTRAALRAAFSEAGLEAFSFSLATIRAFLLNFL